jgi:uncharacterized membrane protein (DUF2068 family)
LEFVIIPIVLTAQNHCNLQMDTQTESQKKNVTILPSALNIATGCTVYSAMKHLAQGIGLAGMERLQNSFALVAFFITRTHMPVTGHKMLQDARNIHCVKMMQMAMFH